MITTQQIVESSRFQMMTAPLVISQRIVFFVRDKGMTIDAAVDAVLGEGTYAEIAAAVYAQFRAET